VFNGFLAVCKELDWGFWDQLVLFSTFKIMGNMVPLSNFSLSNLFSGTN